MGQWRHLRDELGGAVVKFDALTPDDTSLCGGLTDSGRCNKLAVYLARYDDGMEIGALCAPCASNLALLLYADEVPVQ